MLFIFLNKKNINLYLEEETEINKINVDELERFASKYYSFYF